MDTLTTLIQSLKKDQARQFTQFIHRGSSGKAEKLEQLFDLIHKQPEVDSPTLIEAIYGDMGKKHAYHLLRSRLLSELETFLLLQLAGEKGSRHEFLKYYLTSLQLFRSHSTHAWKYLDKAEKMVQQQGMKPFLPAIYDFRLKGIHHRIPKAPDIETVMPKYEDYLQTITQDAKIQYLTHIFHQQYALLIVQANTVAELEAIVEKALRHHGIESTTTQQMSFWILVCNILTGYGGNDHLVKKYLLEKLENPHLPEPDEVNLKLSYYTLLFNLASVCLGERDLVLTKKYIDKVLAFTRNAQAGPAQAMMVLSDYYLFNQQIDEAIATAKKAQQVIEERTKTAAGLWVNARAKLLKFYFIKPDFGAYMALNNELYNNKKQIIHAYPAFGEYLIIKLALQEIVAHICDGESEIALLQIRSFKRKYKSELRKKDFAFEKAMVRILEKICTKANFKNMPAFEQLYQAVLDNPLPVDKRHFDFFIDLEKWLEHWKKGESYQVA